MIKVRLNCWESLRVHTGAPKCALSASGSLRSQVRARLDVLRRAQIVESHLTTRILALIDINSELDCVRARSTATHTD